MAAEFVDCPTCGRASRRGLIRCLFCQARLDEIPPADAGLAPALPSPAPPRAAAYRSPVRRALAVQILLGLWVVLAAASAAANFADWRLISRAVDDPLSLTVAQVEASDDRQAIFAALALGALVVTGIAFIAWMLRMYDNLRPLRSPAPRHSRGWVIGGWLVPILNLWRPKQIVDDLWRCSDPEAPASDFASRRMEVSPLLHVWWMTWVVGGIVGWYVTRLRDVESPEQLVNYIAVDAGLDLVLAGAALAAFAVVTTLTLRQETRAAKLLSADDETPVVRFRSLLPVVGGLAVAAVAVTGIGFVLFDGGTVAKLRPAAGSAVDAADRSSATERSGRAVFLNELQVGDCWHNPELSGSDEVLTLFAVEIVTCDEPHHGEVYARGRLAAGYGEPYPDDVAIEQDAFLVCVGDFDEHFEHGYESSSLDILAIWPEAPGWRAGDREVICSASSLTGATLVGLAVDVETGLPGRDLDVLGVRTCDDLVGVMLATAQGLIDLLDGLTEEEIAEFGLVDVPPGSERQVKRNALLLGQAHHLECSLDALDSQFIQQVGALTATTLTGRALADVFRTGYFDESVVS